jgi:hypothetical protein
MSVKSVVDSYKSQGGWWRKQSWRYGNGYWERVKKDTKEKDKKGKDRNMEFEADVAVGELRGLRSPRYPDGEENYGGYYGGTAF